MGWPIIIGYGVLIVALWPWGLLAAAAHFGILWLTAWRRGR